MSQDGFPLSVTLKAGTGFDSPWIVVYGHAPDEVTEKLKAITTGALIQATVEAASALKAANTAAPLLAHSEPPVQQQAAPAPVQNGWSQQPQAPAPQQQVQRGGGQPYNPQGGGGFGGAQHPEGRQCAVCGNVLEYGKTRTNKGQWKCSQYRYNNGNPNEHTLEWA